MIVSAKKEEYKQQTNDIQIYANIGNHFVVNETIGKIVNLEFNS